MKNVTASKSRLGGNIFLIEETLTDGSIVHNVTIEKIKEDAAGEVVMTFYCTTEAEALELYTTMAKNYFEFG